MKLKTIYLINIIFIFLFSFITHNIYKWCPSTFTAVLFPVNEYMGTSKDDLYYYSFGWNISLFLIKKK